MTDRDTGMLISHDDSPVYMPDYEDEDIWTAAYAALTNQQARIHRLEKTLEYIQNNPLDRRIANLESQISALSASKDNSRKSSIPTVTMTPPTPKSANAPAPPPPPPSVSKGVAPPIRRSSSTTRLQSVSTSGDYVEELKKVLQKRGKIGGAKVSRNRRKRSRRSSLRKIRMK